YQKVDGILVAYNTIYNCDDPLFYNDRSSYDPTGVFAYNLLHSTSTDIVGGDISGTGQGMAYAGNMVNGSPIGVTGSGFSTVNPDFEVDGEIYKPSSSSPMSGAGESNYSAEVNFDLEGLARPDSDMDVGAHEVSGGSGNATYTPHTNDDVRGLVGASFLDADGVFVGNSGVGFLTVSSVPEFSHLAASATISVSSNAAWSAVDDADWISISPSSGNGNGSVYVAVTENTSGSARSGSATISTNTLTRTVTVDQRGFVEPFFVTSVTISPSTATILEGGSVQLTAAVVPEDATDQSVAYSSSDPAVATVDSDGKVTGVSAGSATLTVTTNDGSYTDTCIISVNAISSFTNLALNKPVTGDAPQAENPLSNLTDGDATNRWSAENYPQPATIDLGAVYSLERSELVTYNDRAYQYTIQVATELAGPYAEVVDRTENAIPGLEDSPIEDMLNSVSGRYVRITVIGANVYTGAWTSLSEFRIFGEAVPSIPGYQQWLSDYPALTQTDPAQDSDGDGLANILEYIFQRDPFSADQELGILGEKINGGYQLSFDRASESAQDTIQILQYSSDLENWESLDFTTDESSEVNVETNDASDTVTIVIPGAEISDEKLFWKVSAELGL
ncbi:Ig-like domain-containing protein, partial [Akkermansiaceae bacterium]|nr:Ig-like domain-containing protein [Akkermansiaceae bacterium]